MKLMPLLAEIFLGPNYPKLVELHGQLCATKLRRDGNLSLWFNDGSRFVLKLEEEVLGPKRKASL